MPGWLTDIFRSFFFFIDGIIYKFIDTVYSLFLEIANTSIFTEDMINEFAGKVYALVGIFMLFKVSFSLLTYIINPDEFADKSKGMGKLIKNIITSLALFILVPMIFSEAMDIQRIILKDDIIPRIFSTSDSAQISVSSQDPSMGSEMAVITFKAFYEIDGNYDLQGIFNTDVNQRDSSDNYIVKYTYLISSAVGVVLLLILISFCFDIAVRSVKLGFLRLIAPVPIMTRIDPKKGSELFNKWVKTCTSTYLDLFMRLAAIFFAIYIIKAVTANAGFVDAVTGDPIEVSTFAIVFIILGALMFAKQLPKLIEDLLGIKLSGSFSLNPVKKINEEALGGKRITGAIGGGLARGIPGMVGGFMLGKGFKEGRDSQVAARHALETARSNGSTFLDRTLVRLQTGLGRNTELDALNSEENDIANQINAINESQQAERVMMQHKKDISAAISAEKSHALKAIENGKAGDLSKELNRKKAEIERKKSEMAALQQQSLDMSLTDAQRAAASYEAEAMVEKIAADEAELGRWLNKDAIAEYINAKGNVAGVGKIDDTLTGLMAHTDELVKVHLGEKAYSAKLDGKDYSGRKDYADELDKDVSTINTGFVSQDAQKASLERRREALKEQKRVAQANMTAVNGKK